MGAIDSFIAKYGPGEHCEAVAPDEIRRYADILPTDLLVFWEQRGRCAYGGGLLWFTDPKQLDDVLADWLPAFDLHDGTVFLRSAFGHLYFWAHGSAYSLDVQHGGLSRVTDDFELFISLLEDDEIRERILRASLYEEVKRRIGPPERDECYAFVPALAFGGAEDAKSVQRVKLREQLGLLAQLVL